MKEYDIIVIGSGTASSIALQAAAEGMSVALVDKGPAGGTCLNVGCIPSKMLTNAADRIMDIRESDKFGVSSSVTAIDYSKIREQMKQAVDPHNKRIFDSLERSKGIDFYDVKAHFTGDYSLEAGGREIRGRNVFIGSGARPKIPPIDGIFDVPYLTNETALYLEEAPSSMAIIGGGYIAAELAHFFEAVGTKVTIIQRGSYLVPEEEPEVSDTLRKALERRMIILTDTEAAGVLKDGNEIVVRTKGRDGMTSEVRAEKILVAAGRESNADVLAVEKTGVETDDRGYIVTDGRYRTSKERVWAFGDAIGKGMFTHVANKEAQIAWNDFKTGHSHPIDYEAIPHAVFSRPQIASVGLREIEAKKKEKILLGVARYSDVTKGEALRDDEGFAKIIVGKESGRILGCHIVGPYAPIVIQEVTNAMAVGGEVGLVTEGLHIHPALPEVITAALSRLEEVI